MLRRLNHKRKGQSTAEYAILIGLVIAAAVAMQIYVKRGLQARVHDASLYLVNQTVETEKDILNRELQYEPYYVNSQFTVVRNGSSNIDLKQGVYNSRDYQNTTRNEGYQKYEWSNQFEDK